MITLPGKSKQGFIMGLDLKDRICYYADMDKPSEILRETIKKSGISCRRLSIETGLNRITLLNFIRGGNITARNFDRLCIRLGLELRAVKDQEHKK